MSYLRSRSSTLASIDNNAYDSLPGVSHIIPEKLYPACYGFLSDGLTSHSGSYGTEQADGRKYYYTDIKGSKPIKDPRIGAHFGSQRYKTTSLQLLEQETAIHKKNTYSIDGREWMRIQGNVDRPIAEFGDNGSYITCGNAGNARAVELEITGYFNKANISGFTNSYAGRKWESCFVNGVEVTTDTTLVTAFTSPLGGRYVGAGSLIPIEMGTVTSPQLTTIKLVADSDGESTLYVIELIAQDTTSTTTRNQIQIPSQNVVSYGRKFTVAGTPHYNPFATKGDDSASTIPNNTTGDSVATGWTGTTSAYWDSSLDTATSLGLSAWESGGNFYRPVNGGRIVKWVDSTGAIKTSVNMMPPEASAGGKFMINGSGTSPATGTHNWSTVYQPEFGNKTIGSNLITSWINGENSGALPYDTTFSTSGANISEADSDGSLSYAKTNAFTLTKGKTYRLTILHADVGSGGQAPQFMITTDDTTTQVPAVNPFTSLTESNNNQWIFVSDVTAASCKVFVKNTATAEWSAQTTLYEIEQPDVQSEVAKTFSVHEFGNGAANGGSNAKFADASMASPTADAIGFVMDDGLTSLQSQDTTSDAAISRLEVGNSNDESCCLTFIGTGISYTGGHSGQPGPFHIAQNLPYGTHTLIITRDTATSDTGKIRVDDVELWDQPSGIYGMRYPKDISFYQPKMPPIPEDAVVLADYMLMADFVPQTTSDNNPNKISKGTRLIACSRDFHYDGSAGHVVHANSFVPQGQINTKTGVQAIIQDFGTGTVDCTLPYFGFTSGEMTDMRGTDVAQMQMQLTNSSGTVEATNVTIVSSGTVGSSNTLTDTDGVVNTATFSKSDGVLGTNKARSHYTGQNASNYDWMYFCGMCVASPIHTSSHYQTFETPWLHELVGGDRNMEQTNLVVTPEGKTWDEVTRDTSYIGYDVLKAGYDGGDVGLNTTIIFDDHRGTVGAYTESTLFCKDFAIARDMFICRRSGSYSFFSYTIARDSGTSEAHGTIKINGSTLHQGYTSSSGHSQTMQNVSADLDIGDYVQVLGSWHQGNEYSGFWIKRNPEPDRQAEDRLSTHRNWHPRLEYSRSKRN